VEISGIGALENPVVVNGALNEAGAAE